jgi:fibronectin type 3 domain-containing protein
VKISEGRNDLKAISTNSYGVVSPESSTVTVFLDPRPQPPAGLTATAGDTVVTLTWTPNPETDILHYDIYRDGFRLSRWQAEATFKDMRLTNGRPYTYTIIAIDSRGIESNKTSTITVTPVAGPEWGSP